MWPHVCYTLPPWLLDLDPGLPVACGLWLCLLSVAPGLTVCVLAQMVACTPVGRLGIPVGVGYAACDLCPAGSLFACGVACASCGEWAMDPCVTDFTLALSTLSAWSIGV